MLVSEVARTGTWVARQAATQSLSREPFMSLGSVMMGFFHAESSVKEKKVMVLQVR